MKIIMNKIFKFIIASAVTATAFVSCTDEVKFGGAFIEKAPGGTVTFDTIFSNEEYANQFLNAIYSRQYYGLPFNADVCNNASPYTGKLDGLTDLYHLHWASAAISTRYYTGTQSASDWPLMSFDHDLVWEAVRQVWMLVENIDRVPGLSKEKRDYMVAQAKMILANRYFDLLPHYGGLPLVNKSYTGTESDFTLPRMTFEATVDTIVKWIDESAPNLPWAYDGNTTETNSTQTGRWTKAGALSLKAKVLWLAASPLYNTDKPYFGGSSEAEQQHLVCYPDFQQARWERALKAFEDFWTANNGDGKNGYYHLVQAAKKNCDAYRIAYRQGYILDDSPENIHWTKVCDIYGTQGTYSWLMWSWQYNGIYRNVYAPTLEYIEMFPWSDGKPFVHDTDMKYLRTDEVELSETEKLSIDVYDNSKLFYEVKTDRYGTKKTASRDPRLYENAMVTGQQNITDWQNPEGKATGNITETWVGGQDASYNVKSKDRTVNGAYTTFCPTGFGAYKYVLTEPEYHRNHNMHWNVLTIPDMILMYAECLAECGQLDNAIKQVDLVRERVGLKSLTTSSFKLDVKGNKDNLIEEILRERACELGMTNSRYIDMIRRVRTDWMVKHLHGMATYRVMKDPKNNNIRVEKPYFGDDADSGMAEPNMFEYEFFEIQTNPRVLWGQDPNSQDVKKWLMMAYPQIEINKNYGLIQNPGW